MKYVFPHVSLEHVSVYLKCYIKIHLKQELDALEAHTKFDMATQLLLYE